MRAVLLAVVLALGAAAGAPPAAAEAKAEKPRKLQESSWFTSISNFPSTLFNLWESFVVNSVDSPRVHDLEIQIEHLEAQHEADTARYQFLVSEADAKQESSLLECEVELASAKEQTNRCGGVHCLDVCAVNYGLSAHAVSNAQIYGIQLFSTDGVYRTVSENRGEFGIGQEIKNMQIHPYGDGYNVCTDTSEATESPNDDYEPHFAWTEEEYWKQKGVAEVKFDRYANRGCWNAMVKYDLALQAWACFLQCTDYVTGVPVDGTVYADFLDGMEGSFPESYLQKWYESTMGVAYRIVTPESANLRDEQDPKTGSYEKYFPTDPSLGKRKSIFFTTRMCPETKEKPKKAVLDQFLEGRLVEKKPPSTCNEAREIGIGCPNPYCNGECSTGLYCAKTSPGAETCQPGGV